MTILESILLGAVEGISEFLPISSTAHLILTSHLLGLPQSDFQKSFEIAIQLGAIFAAALLYGKTLLRSKAVVMRVVVAFIPTAVIGFFLHGFVKNILMESTQTILWSLFLGGLLMIIFEFFHIEKKAIDLERMPYKTAFTIGLFQSLAIVPGVSRSGGTIIGGLLLGMERKAIVDFSFLLAIPTMVAATGFDLMKSAPSFTWDQTSTLIIGFLVSFLVAIFAIKWMLIFIKNHTFMSFGLYRMTAAAIFWFALT